MANLPYSVYGVITDTDATNPSGAKVVLRNDTNGETTTALTSASGKYVLDAANLSSGYITTDRLTVQCAWGLAENESSFLITDDTHEVDLTLVTVEDSADTTYCTIQDVLDELGDKTTDDISYNRVRKIILRSEAEIEDRTETKFKSVTLTEEEYDINQYTSYKSPDQLESYNTPMLVGSRNDYMNTYFNDRILLNKTPILAITTLQKNDAGKSATDDWTTLTQQTGSGGDFIVETDTGIVTFVNNIPTKGMRKVRVTYNYGYSTVPKVVEKLCILLSVRDVLVSKGNDTTMSSINSISLGGELSVSSGISGTVGYYTWLVSEIDKMWEVVGDFVNKTA